MPYNRTDPISGNSRKILIMILIFFMVISVFQFPSTGIKFIEGNPFYGTSPTNVGNLTAIGDLDNDGYIDLLLTQPMSSTYATNGGVAFLFYGKEGGFGELRPSTADVIFRGGANAMLGSSFAIWDREDTGYPEMVLGCPGHFDGNGSALVFDSAMVNGAPKGTILDPTSAETIYSRENTTGFGRSILTGSFTEEMTNDILIMSNGNLTSPPQVHAFLDGGDPENGIDIELPSLSVTEGTDCVAIDMMGRGKDALVYSSPERAEVRIVYFETISSTISLPGSNSTNVIDFEGVIGSTGNTWGWGASDDGWDTSPSHIYDEDTGSESLRFNQATGNVNNYDRSVENVNRLDIEIGGILTRSNEGDESGAYGIGFYLSNENIRGNDSAVLSFDMSWENWGFENDERLWAKGRITNNLGTGHWLGWDLDSNPEPDPTPELWTLRGTSSGGSGIDQSGVEQIEVDIFPSLIGEGEYYLELGGKISRWTTSSERASFGFDNITLNFRSMETDIKKITGANGIGSTLFAADVNDDSFEDLVVSNARNSRVRVFFGNDTHWDNIPGINSDMDNITIVGEGGSGFGTSMAIVGTSPFTPDDAILISQPWLPSDIGSGAIASFDLPLESEYMAPSSDGFVLHSTNGTRFGICIVSIGDTDVDGYPEFIIGSYDETERLNMLKFDRGANEPMLSLDSPSREKPLQGNVEIKASVNDLDGDAHPQDIKFYWSVDNRSWAALGNGTPDRIEGNQAIKVWNTSEVKNSLYFLKVEVEDGFGLVASRYSNSIEVLNHKAPSIILTYPIGGTNLKGTEEITAKVILAEKEVLLPPVRFFMSRDGETWEEFGNASTPNTGSETDFTYLLDTSVLEDGAIYFKANATTEYGLGSEAMNGVPCFIDNAYVPEIEFTGNYSGIKRGILNITAHITDKDMDIDPPVEIFLRDPSVIPWEFLGNMTGPVGNNTYFFDLDTTTLGNAVYEFMIRVEDLTFNQEEEILNTTVTIHNLYTPTIEFKDINGSSVFSGIPRIRASVWDRDGNYNSSGLAFYYRPESVELWNRIPQALLNGGVGTVDWDTTELANGRYDLMVEIVDEDGLIGSDIIEGVTVKNVRPPTVEGDLPSTDGKLDGRVTIRFNITDDQEIPERSIKVEVFVLSEWVEIEGVERTNPDLVFVPGSPVSYQIIWNTAAVDEDGVIMYPDAPGYEIRITVTDPDGESDSWTTPISFRVDNENGDKTGDDDDDGGDDSPINTGLIAVVIFAGIIIIALIIIVLIMWFGRRSEKQGSMPVVTSTKKKEKKKVEVVEEEEEEEKPDDLYSPGGWGQDTSSIYETEPPAREEPVYRPEPAAVTPPPADDLFSDIFSVGGTSGTVDRQKAAPSPLDDLKVDIDLPEEAMPIVEEEEEEVEEEWGDVEDWGDDDDEDEWEELDEVEEEDWGDDDDEDEWEDEEDEEEILVVRCRCGEDIEIPESRKNRKFSCPSCGRTGKLRK